MRSSSLSVPRGITWTTSVNATKWSFVRAPIEAERPVSTCPSSVRRPALLETVVFIGLAERPH